MGPGLPLAGLEGPSGQGGPMAPAWGEDDELHLLALFALVEDLAKVRLGHAVPEDEGDHRHVLCMLGRHAIGVWIALCSVDAEGEAHALSKGGGVEVWALARHQRQHAVQVRPVEIAH